MSHSPYITLSSDSEEEMVAGIPRSFENDPLSKFSFSCTPVAGRSRCLNEVEDGIVDAVVSPAKKKSRKEKGCVVENEFYGVYCLISRSDRACYKNRCYVGYTVDPNRRINQHNGGRGKGGAKKTDSRGPWDMVCVVHGFPNHVAALRFEWAWQNPGVSKVIREIGLKKERKETPFQYQFRIACHLMRSSPFQRFALTFRWLITGEELPYPVSCAPPQHVKKRYGRVRKEISEVPSGRDGYVPRGECGLCGKEIAKIWHLVRCVASTDCRAHFHATCLAANGVRGGEMHAFPLSGNCPMCGGHYLWGDLIREQRRILKISTRAPDELKDQVVRKDIACREISPPPAIK